MESFIHFPVQGVIIYSEYKYTVLSNHVDIHLKDGGKYKAVKADRERVIQAIQAIIGLKTKIADLNYLVFPPVSNLSILILQ